MTSTPKRTLHVYGKLDAKPLELALALRGLADTIEDGGPDAVEALAVALAPEYDDHTVSIAGSYLQGGFWSVGRETEPSGD